MNKYLFSIYLLICIVGNAQNDTIHLRNNDLLVGEIKSFTTGVLIIKTSYSDKDFRVEFSKVTGLAIERKSIIILTEGRRRFGYIRSDSPGMVMITLEDNTVEHYKLEEVVALHEIDENFWRRFKIAIDLGFNLTKANNNIQFTIGGELDYTDEKWLFDGNLSVLNSTQDNTERIQRSDANVSLIRILNRKWYLLGDVSFLANTEQALNGRFSPSIGVGKFLISTNKLFLGLSLGFAYNIENFKDASLNKTSSEILIGLNYNMFDFEDLDLNTGVKFYPSLSEKGRIRTDYDLTLKYDLPWDFYIKLAFTLNFDNQPAIDASKLDYIFTSGFGWKIN
jgi:putative salt-induced outer membrane protein YdiY